MFAPLPIQKKKIVPLPVAGIMSDKSAQEIGVAYATLDAMAKKMGSTLASALHDVVIYGIVGDTRSKIIRQRLV